MTRDDSMEPSVQPGHAGRSPAAGTGASCPSCAGFQREVEEMRGDVERLLLELAREREKVNALRLSWIPRPPLSPEPPLRHVLIDRLNDGAKRFIGPAHGVAKRMVTASLRLLRRNSMG